MPPSSFAGLILLAAALAVGCQPAGDAATVTPPPEGPVAKVRVYAEGTVTLDGQSIAIDDLRASLAGHKRKKGVVWYYRENSKRGEPHPKALEVLQIITEAGLPISLSDKEDFSTVVSPSDGQSRPRE